METLSALLAICEGNPPITGGSTYKGPDMRGFDIFYGVSLTQLLNKQLSRRCS